VNPVGKKSGEGGVGMAEDTQRKTNADRPNKRKLHQERKELRSGGPPQRGKAKGKGKKFLTWELQRSVSKGDFNMGGGEVVERKNSMGSRMVMKKGGLHVD